MLWLIVFGLMVVCAELFRRVKLAEQRIDDLESQHFELVSNSAASASRREVAGAADEGDEIAPSRDVGPPEADAEVPTSGETNKGLRLVAAFEAPREEALRTEAGSNSPPDTREIPAQEPLSPEPEIKRSFDFEEIFGRRLPIWAGGITLAVAGVFLVRYSIEAGLLTASVRVILAFLFGIGLLAGAELAYRFEARVGDERVRQALAGAGLATLYAGFYLAGTQYGLIGQTFAFLGLAAVTALSIALSYRFGLPSAVLGLIGGFAAPALVGGEDANLPLLTLYLALVTAGLVQTGNRQERAWLGPAALIGGLGWGALLLLSDALTLSDIGALGLYFVVLGVVLPALIAPDRFETPLRLASAGIASLQLAFLVEQGGFEPLSWGLYLLLGLALAWFGLKQVEFRRAGAMASVIGLVLYARWYDADIAWFAVVGAALVAVFAAIPAWHIWRRDDDIADRFMATLVPLFTGFVFLESMERVLSEGFMALALFALALIPMLSSRLLWPRDDRRALAAGLGASAILSTLAAWQTVPGWSYVLIIAAAASALIWLLRGRLEESRSFPALIWMGMLATLVALFAWGHFSELDALSEGTDAASFKALLRWLAAGAPFAAMAIFEKRAIPRGGAEFIAALLAFAAFAQVLPAIALVWAAALVVVALRWKLPERDKAMIALIACILSWALPPIATWLQAGLAALAGDPVLLDDIPALRDALGFILPLAVALAAARLDVRQLAQRPVPLAALAFPVAMIVAHTLYKQLFALSSNTEFALLALAERTIWQALLVAAAWVAARGAWKLPASKAVAVTLAGISLGHFTCFTLLIHNPLIETQAVGPMPIANLVLAAYATGIAALLLLRHHLPQFRQVTDAAVMLLATIGAITLLRQLFAGSILPDDPMTQTEDLLRSLVGILMALAFLLVGSRRGERSWRVGSLVLMLATVFKVFIFDTAGLEGLIRIASFVALGASLIGIGWFYSRQLKAEPAPQ